MQKVDWKVADTLFPVKEIPAVGIMESTEPGIDYEDIDKTGYKFIMREDTGEILSCLTDEYKLVTNKELYDYTSKVVSSLKGTLVEARTYNGKRTMYKWRFKDSIDLGKGEGHKPEIIVNNSYDGSCEVSVLAGAFRLVCSNGMVVGTVLGNASNRHSVWNKNLKDIEKMIHTSIEDIASLLQKGFDLMANKEVLQKHIKGLFKIFPTQANEQLAQYLMANKPKTYWDLYNAGTWLLTHGMNRRSWSTTKIETALFKTVNNWAKAAK